MKADKTIIRFDSQILNNLESCARKLKWASHVGYVPEHKADSLSKGILVHDAMAAYYTAIKDGISRRDAIDAMIAAIDKKILKTDLDLPVAMEVKKAATEYAMFRIEDSWIPLAIEQPFSYTIYEDDDYIFLHEGIVDLVIADVNIKMAVVDHKSSSRNSYVSSMSNQFKGYARAFSCPNMIVNKIGFQKTLPPAQKFVRSLMSYPQSVIEEWEQKVIRRMKRYAMMLNDPVAMDEANETSCDKYSGCVYRSVCEQSPQVRENLLLANFRVRGAWDPFKRDEEDD